jgi:hypothetical protein
MRSLTAARLRRHWVLVVLLLVVVVLVTRWTGEIAGTKATRALDERLADAGRGTNTDMVEVERDHLAALRAFAFASGLPEALDALDVAAVERLLTPVDANLGTPMVDILDPDGRVIFAFRAEGQQAPIYGERAAIGIVAKALAGESDQYGERFATLVVSDEGPLVASTSPVRLGGRVVGAIMVMTPLEDVLAADTAKHGALLTVYTGTSGVPLATTAPVKPRTLPRALEHLLPAEALPVTSGYDVPGGRVREQLGQLVIRHEPVAWLGTAEKDRIGSTVLQVRLVTVGGLLAVLALGLVLATLWTRFDDAGDESEQTPGERRRRAIEQARDDDALGTRHVETPTEPARQGSGRQRW